MARADLILDLIKYSFEGNKYQCKKVVEALVAEERSKQHLLLADKLQKELGKLCKTLDSSYWPFGGLIFERPGRIFQSRGID